MVQSSVARYNRPTAMLVGRFPASILAFVNPSPTRFKRNRMPPAFEFSGGSPDGESDSDRARLMHWDSRWRQEFEQTRSSLLQCGDGRIVDVIHVGGTAVPGLIARPIIDVVAVVADLVDLSDSGLLIEGLNFREVPVPEWSREYHGICKTLQKPRHGESTHFVWLTTQGSKLTESMVSFRDSLRDDSATAMHWEEIKVACWKESEGRLADYQSRLAEHF